MSSNASKVMAAVGRLLAVFGVFALIVVADRAAVRWIGPGIGDLFVLFVVAVVGLAAWAQAPLWERYFGILIGIPMACALLRRALMHWYGEIAGTYALLAGLVALAICMYAGRKHHGHGHGLAPQAISTQERNFQLTILAQIILVFMFLALAAGSVVGLCAILSSGGPLWVRIVDGFIGLVGLICTYALWEIVRATSIWGPPASHAPHSSRHKTVKAESKQEAVPSESD
jgi:hypothetical protein